MAIAMKHRLVATIALVVFAGCAAGREDDASEATLVLTNASLIDGNGGSISMVATVEISGVRISKVYIGTYDAKPNGSARVVDLKGAFLMPGLWNNHSHLADLLPDPKDTLGKETAIDASIRAGRNAMDALRAGFT